MTMADELGRFVAGARWEDVPAPARRALKLRVLDSLGCAIGALDAPPVRAIRADIEAFGGSPACSLIGGGRCAPADAALYNGALVRYLDFNDSYVAPGETCHPSDNLGAVLAAAQWAERDGRTLLTALAVAYQVQCRLSREAPVRRRCFDHVTHGAYAAAAGVACALGLDGERTAHAVAIAGTALNALRSTRTSLSNWKGLAAPFAAFAATRATFLAARGVTGPRAVLEGRKGFMEAIAGPFTIDWRAEGLDAALETVLKRFAAEVHAQSAVEAVLELRREHGIRATDVRGVEVDTFDVARSIIGGGDEGQKHRVATREEADHSLPYVVAVALVDGRVAPEQYEADRILAREVQRLIARVAVREDPALSRRFPAELPTRVRILLADGRVVAREQRDYLGFGTRPATRAAIEEKFAGLAGARAGPGLCARITHCVDALEDARAEDLTSLLEEVEAPAAAAAGSGT